MRPSISIIVPVYNAEKTLKRCVDSILAQDYADYEVILVDDGSADQSGAICEEYAERDKRICVIHQGNAGVSAARNAGIQTAKGIYLLFLDSDDALEANALQVYDDACGHGYYDVIIGSLSVVGENVPRRKISVQQEICAGSEIWESICADSGIFGYAGGKMIRTDLVRENGVVFDAGMRSQEDLDFFLSAYAFCSRFRLIPDTVYRYYYAPPTRTPPVWDFIANQLKLLRIARAKINLSEEARACVQQRILLLLYTGLYAATEQGRFEETARRIAQVEGLREWLKTVNAKGERGFVARSFADGRYGRIYRYFVIRNRIRDVVRAVRARTAAKR